MAAAIPPHVTLLPPTLDRAAPHGRLPRPPACGRLGRRAVRDDPVGNRNLPACVAGRLRPGVPRDLPLRGPGARGAVADPSNGPSTSPTTRTSRSPTTSTRRRSTGPSSRLPSSGAGSWSPRSSSTSTTTTGSGGCSTRSGWGVTWRRFPSDVAPSRRNGEHSGVLGGRARGWRRDPTVAAQSGRSPQVPPRPHRHRPDAPPGNGGPAHAPHRRAGPRRHRDGSRGCRARPAPRSAVRPGPRRAVTTRLDGRDRSRRCCCRAAGPRGGHRLLRRRPPHPRCRRVRGRHPGSRRGGPRWAPRDDRHRADEPRHGLRVHPHR